MSLFETRLKSTVCSNPSNKTFNLVVTAQLVGCPYGSALDWGAGGHWFKSRWFQLWSVVHKERQRSPKSNPIVTPLYHQLYASGLNIMAAMLNKDNAMVVAKPRSQTKDCERIELFEAFNCFIWNELHREIGTYQIVVLRTICTTKMENRL